MARGWQPEQFNGQKDDKPTPEMEVGLQLFRKNRQLQLSNGNSAFRTDLDTGLTTKTFIGMYRLGLAILHLEYLCWASTYAFLITSTLVFINNDFPHDSFLQGMNSINGTLAEATLQRCAAVAHFMRTYSKQLIYRAGSSFVKIKYGLDWKAASLLPPNFIDKANLRGYASWHPYQKQWH
jgi:hypothetical protein